MQSGQNGPSGGMSHFGCGFLPTVYQGVPFRSNGEPVLFLKNCFSMWFAGSGMKPGFTLGQGDEFGFNVAEDPVHVHDLHATLLPLLRFEHTKLAVKSQGLDMRLTNVHGELVTKLLA